MVNQVKYIKMKINQYIYYTIHMEEMLKAQESIMQKNSELEQQTSLQSEQIRRLQELNVTLNSENDSLMKQNEELLSLEKN